MQKNTYKIYALKNLPRNSQPDDILSTYPFPKNWCSTLGRYGRVRIEIKHLCPCFIAVIKYGYSFWC